MLEFLKTHPSLFIIGATIIIIILIFLFFMKKSTQEFKIEPIETDSQRNEYIELQQIPDEVDTSTPTTPPLPAPKLIRKLRYDSSNQPNTSLHIYATPRIQEYEAIPESVTDESCSSFSYVPAELHQQTPGTSGNSENTGNQVVFRQPQSKNQDNRVSVSEVHKHGSYVSFDWEFETFEEFRKSCQNTMRITVDFDSNNTNYIVPVADEI